MRAHILTVRFNGTIDHIPEYLAGRAAVLLREVYSEESMTRRWIDSGARRTFGKDTIVLEIVCPNNVPSEIVLGAVNRAVRSEMPGISNDQWEALIFAIIPCANQAR